MYSAGRKAGMPDVRGWAPACWRGASLPQARRSPHRRGLGKLLDAEGIVPPDADVANAIGAVTGQVRVTAEILVTQPSEGVFRVAVGPDLQDHAEEAGALAAAEEAAIASARKRAVTAGTDTASITVQRHIRAAEVEGRRMFVEARIIATASGRPRITVPELAGSP
jgi:hypothetical protein